MLCVCNDKDVLILLFNSYVWFGCSESQVDYLLVCHLLIEQLVVIRKLVNYIRFLKLTLYVWMRALLRVLQLSITFHFVSHFLVYLYFLCLYFLQSLLCWSSSFSFVVLFPTQYTLGSPFIVHSAYVATPHQSPCLHKESLDVSVLLPVFPFVYWDVN